LLTSSGEVLELYSNRVTEPGKEPGLVMSSVQKIECF
jgi:hypothetical protein